MLVIGPHGRALRGDASIAPYIPFTDGTVGRGLDPSYAVCNDGDIYHLLHNKKSYVGGGVPDAPDGAYVIACGGARPLPTNRWKMTSNIKTVNRIHLRADMESVPTVARCGLPYGRRGRFYIGPSGASALGGQSDGRHPAKPARSCGSMPHRGIDRCAPPQRRPLRTGFRQAMEGERGCNAELAGR